MTMSVVMVYGSIITSVLSSAAFITALILAYLSKDQEHLGLLIGAVIANFSTVVSFWVGSSAGSQRKDETNKP